MSATVADFNQSELLPEKIQELVSQNALDLDWIVSKGLWDGRTFMRRNASGALRFSGGPPTDQANLLLVAAKDSDPEVRINVVLTLGTADMLPEMAMQGLLRALHDREERVRSAAQESLERLAQKVGTPLVPLLVDVLALPDSLARMLASQLLVRYQAEAAPALLAALLTENPVMVKEALSTLVRLGMSAGEALVDALQDHRLRVHASRLLLLLPGLKEEALQKLRALAESEDPGLASLAANVLSQVKAAEKRRAAGPLVVPVAGFGDHILNPEEIEAAGQTDLSIAALLHELGNGAALIRANAAALLGQVAARCEPDIKALIGLAVAALVRDGEAEVRRAVVKASAQLQTQDSVEALVKGLADADAEVVETARSSLSRLKPEALPWLVATVKSQQSLATHQAILDALVATGAPAVSILSEALRTSLIPTTRSLAARALEKIGREATNAVPMLIDALGDEVDEVREAAVSALGFVAQEEPGVIDAVKKAIRDGALPVRVAASIALERIKGTYQPPEAAREPEPVPIDGFEEKRFTAEELAKLAAAVPVRQLVRALSDGRPVVRHNAALALANHGEDRSTAARALAVSVLDSDSLVRWAAITALGLLGAEQADVSAPMLIRALGDSQPEVAQTAQAALSALGAAAVPALVESLDCDPDKALRSVIPLLVATGGAAVQPLVGALGHLSIRVRTNAIRSLERIGRDAGAAVAALVGTLADEADDVREAAACALGFVAQPEPSVLDALKAASRDRVLPVRVAASIALERVKGTYQPPQAAREAEPIPIDGFEERLLSAADLAKAAAKVPAAQLIRALSDGRPTVRTNAALALGGHTEDRPTAARVLGVATMDSDPQVRWAAASALGQLGAEQAESSAPPLIRALSDSNQEVAQAAQAALTALGAQAIPVLVEALDCDPDKAARTVLPILVAIGKEVVESLVRALGHLSVRVRASAARGLGMLGPELGRPAREAVHNATQDTNELVKAEAKRARDAIDGVVPPPRVLEPEPPPLPDFDTQPLAPEEIKKQVKKLDVDRLIRALSDGRTLMRYNAAVALGLMGKSAVQAAPALALAIRDERPEVRASAAQALSSLGSEAIEPAVPALLKALSDPVKEVAAAAYTSLDGFGAEALDPLVQALDCDPELALRTVLPFLVKLGKEAVSPLVQALDHLSVRVRANAVQGLGLIGPAAASQARDRLQQALSDPDDTVKAYSRRAIDAVDGVVPTPKVIEPEPLPLPEFETEVLAAADLKKQAKKLDVDRLVRALRDGRSLVRVNAATALGVLGSAAERAATALAMAVRDESLEVRQQAAIALGAIGSAGVSVAIPALLRALNDPSPVVVEAATKAIEALGADAVDPLVEALNCDPAQADNTVVPALVALGQAIIGPVSAVIDHLSVWVRINAVKTLGMLGPKDGMPARAAIEAATRDPNELVRARAGEALDRIDGVEPLPLVLEPEPLPLDDFGTQSLDAEFLKKQAKSLQVDRLKRALFDGRTYVRENAARALGTLGKAAEEALIEMLVVLKDGEWSVRNAMAIALGQLKFAPEQTVPALALALKGKDPKLEATVVEAIDNFGKAAIDPLLDLLHGRPESVLPSVGRVCYHLADTFLKPLTERLGPEHSIVVRENAADVLGAMVYKARPAKKAILEALKEMDILFRVKLIRAAVNVLGRDTDLLIALKDIRDTDNRPSIQIVLEDIFIRLGVR